MSPLTRLLILGCVVLAALLAHPAAAQYGGRYSGGNGTRYTNPRSAAGSLLLQHSIRRAQIRKQARRTSRTRRAASGSRSRTAQARRYRR